MPSHRGFMNIFSFLVAFTQMASNISYFPIAFLTDGYIYLFSFPITFPYGYISFGYIYFFSFPITFPYGYISFGYIYFFSFPITLPYGYIYILDAYISFFPITFPYGYIYFGYIYFFSFPITFPYGYISFGPQTRLAKFMFPSSIPLQCLTSNIAFVIKWIYITIYNEDKIYPFRYLQYSRRLFGERSDTSSISRLPLNSHIFLFPLAQKIPFCIKCYCISSRKNNWHLSWLKTMLRCDSLTFVVLWCHI